MVYILCPEQFVIAINLLMFIFTVSIAQALNVPRIDFYRFYKQQYAAYKLAPPRWVYGVVWAVLYTLIFVGWYLVALNDDTCACDRYDPSKVEMDDDDDTVDPRGVPCIGVYSRGGVQNAAWYLFIINMLLNMSFVVFVVGSFTKTRAMLAFVAVVLTLVTAVAEVVLVGLLAANMSSALWFTFIAYIVYSAWLVIATILASNMYYKYDAYAKGIVDAQNAPPASGSTTFGARLFAGAAKAHYK